MFITDLQCYLFNINLKINFSDDENDNGDKENAQSGSTIQSAAKSTIPSILTQEDIFETLEDLERFGNNTEFQRRLDGLSPQSRKAYFDSRYPIYPKPKMKSSNEIVEELPCLDTKIDQELELVETRPIVQQVVSSTTGNKDKNKRKRKSEAAQASLNGVIAKLNECFNEINSVWAQNPRNSSLSFIPAEILKVRELVSDELEKFTENTEQSIHASIFNSFSLPI